MKKSETQEQTLTREDLVSTVRLIEGPERFAAQYEKTLEALSTFGIDHTGVPTLDIILSKLTPEVLEAAEKMYEPRLLLVPPLSRKELVAVIDAWKDTSHIQHKTYFDYLPEDDNLYNDGKLETDLAWEVCVVEGIQDVPVNEAAQYINGAPIRHDEQVRALVRYYRGLGLDVLSGARRYLILMLQALFEGRPIDLYFWTVLNPHLVEADKKALIGGGNCYFDQIILGGAGPGDYGYDLRLRTAKELSL